MKKIENSKNYFADEEGRIYKKYRNNRVAELNTNKNSAGYRTVSISYLDGKTKLQYVHRIIATLFIDNPENKPLVNHKNLCKHDNRVENLEWVTHLENSRHAIDNGVRLKNGEPFNAIYPTFIIQRVCELLSEGRRVVDVAKQCGVSDKTVSQIKRREAWNHISKDFYFPPKTRTVSDKTVVFICMKILEGFSNIEISKMTGNKVSRQKINQVRTGLIYKDISEKYL